MKRILTFMLAGITLYACKKERSFSEPQSEPNVSTPTAQKLYLNDVAIELPNARSLRTDPGFFRSHIKRMKTVLLDFDGHTVRNTSWNYSGKDLICKPAKLTKEQKDQILATAIEDYAPWNIKISMNEADYNNAPIDGRMRVVICDDSWQWYGKVGGVSYINSMFWGDNSPCFVFSDLLGNQTKYVAEATSHEIGHTIGLGHASDWSADCSTVSEYSLGIGTGPTGFCNIEGAGYYKQVVAFTRDAKTPWGCESYTDQIDVITQALGEKIDLIGDKQSHATEIDRPVEIQSVIENSDDVDMFEVELDRVAAVSVVSGGNTDLKIVLYVNNTVIATYDDMQSLSVSKRKLPVTLLRHKKVYIAVQRSNDDPGSFIPRNSSTGGYVLKFTKF